MRRLAVRLLMIPTFVAGIIMYLVVSASPSAILALWGATFLAGEHYQLGWWARGFLVIVLAIYIWLKVSNWRHRNSAANNVILAKHTFSQLPEPDRLRVHDRAVEIINRIGGKFTTFEDETSKYGWYALALHELGIPPSMPGEKDWLYVANPYLAILPGDPMLKAVSEFYRKRHGVQVEISQESTPFSTKH